MLNIHPQYAKVHDNEGLFWDDHVKAPAQTRIWSSGIGCNGKGSWVDMTSATGRQWWADGVKSLIDAGMDGMWK